MKYPHCQAAFINAIAEEGTKAEAVAHLQETWNELCYVRKQLTKAQEGLFRADEHHQEHHKKEKPNV